LRYLLAKKEIGEGFTLEKDEGIVKLYGASNFSPYSFCRDCTKPIMDFSRTRKKERCENCKKNRNELVKKISAKRFSDQRKAMKEAKENS
jgi:hypothetical protein